MESVNGLYKTKCIRTMFFHVDAFNTPLTSSTGQPAGDWCNSRTLPALAPNTRIEDEATRYATLLNGLRLG